MKNILPFLRNKLYLLNLIISVTTLLTLTRMSFFTVSHLPNFSAVGAVAIFSGICTRKWWIGYLITFFAIFFGDLLLNKIILHQWIIFYKGCYWQYAGYLLMTLMGSKLKTNMTFLNLSITGFLGSIMFFLLSNFGVWYSGMMYSANIEGLYQCYIAGIPFFKNTLLSNLIYLLFFFSMFKIITKNTSSFKESLLLDLK